MMERFGSSEFSDTVKRIESHSSVSGVIVTNPSGNVVHTTLDDSQTTYYVQRCSALIELARSSIRDLDPTDDVQFLRIRSHEYELLIATTKEYTLLVKQKMNVSHGREKLWEITRRR